jgi:hypothetical protein
VSKVPEKMELAPQARKLVELHSRAIESASDEAAKKLTSPASVLTAVCNLLSLRQRDMAATGEHFSVQEYQGIQVIDTLDECRLRSARALLSGYLERTRRKLDTRAQDLLAEKLSPGPRELPPYPVGYMVHFLLVTTVQAFEPVVKAGHGFDAPVLELALLHRLLSILDKYVQTREKPVMRHFSDVAREYSVVMRLKCGCGAEKYDVKLQALCQTSRGEPFDRLDLQCKDCGSQRSITFDLPHFKDMYQI